MIVGTVESLWRYPVKSMAGEALGEAFLGYAGMYGDRMYGFVNSVAPTVAPFLTARDCREMVRYRPRFRNPALVITPNQSEAGQVGAGLTPLCPDTSALMVDVETPTGERLAVDHPMLLAELARRLSKGQLSLVRSDRAMTDCYPISLISLQTINQLGEEVNTALDKRRFRANIYARLTTDVPFAEDSFIGKRLQIGSRVVVAAIIRDKRCKMITIDPDTAEETLPIMRNVARSHEGNVGIYCAVMTHGLVRVGGSIALLD